MGPYARIKRKPRVPQAFWGNDMLGPYVDGVSDRLGDRTRPPFQFLHYVGFYELKRYAGNMLDLNNNKKKVL